MVGDCLSDVSVRNPRGVRQRANRVADAYSLALREGARCMRPLPESRGLRHLCGGRKTCAAGGASFVCVRVPTASWHGEHRASPARRAGSRGAAGRRAGHTRAPRGAARRVEAASHGLRGARARCSPVPSRGNVRPPQPEATSNKLSATGAQHRHEHSWRE